MLLHQLVPLSNLLVVNFREAIPGRSWVHLQYVIQIYSITLQSSIISPIYIENRIMFKHIRQREGTAKQQYNKKSTTARKAPATTRTYLQQYKKTSSYTQLKPKVDPDPITTLEGQLQMINTPTYLYQGFVRNRQKHGQGIMLMRNGLMIIGIHMGSIGKWMYDVLHGRAIIFPPLGGKILCTFNEGKLNGWALGRYLKRVIFCIKYYQNKIEGEKLIYEQNEKMWIASRHSEDGKLISVAHIQKGTSDRLPFFIHSDQLQELYPQYILQEQNYLQFTYINQLKIDKVISYIGYADQIGKPFGLGIIYSKEQSYLGNYYDGILEQYGRIVFRNGQIYQGEINGGVFTGQGILYKPETNVSCVMEDIQGEQTVVEQHKGYIIINIDPDPSLGTVLNSSSNGVKGESLKSICQIIQMYYLRYFIDQREFNRDTVVNLDQFDRSEEGTEKFTPLSQPIKPMKDQRWIKFDNNEEDPKLKRINSLDKREAMHNKLNKLNIQNKAQYQSLVVKENSQPQESQSFKKGAPNVIQIHQIPFTDRDRKGLMKEKQKQKEDSQTQSLEINKLKMRDQSDALRNRVVDKSLTPPLRSMTAQPMIDHFQLQKYDKESQASQSYKLSKMFQKTRSNRKRIFD